MPQSPPVPHLEDASAQVHTSGFSGCYCCLCAVQTFQILVMSASCICCSRHCVSVGSRLLGYPNCLPSWALTGYLLQPSLHDCLQRDHRIDDMLNLLVLLSSALAAGAIIFALRRYRKVRLLKNIPGPPTASFIAGRILNLTLCQCTQFSRIGNLRQMFDEYASDFQALIEQRYGRIIRLNGFLGVSIGST
jgi:hypothetical protein